MKFVFLSQFYELLTTIEQKALREKNMSDDWLEKTLEDIQAYCELNRLTMLGAIMPKAQRALSFDREIKSQLEKVQFSKKLDDDRIH